MEEILASIRRIIADDQEGPKAVEPQPASTPAKPHSEPVNVPPPVIIEAGPPLDDDVLDLAEIVLHEPPPKYPEPTRVAFSESREKREPPEIAIEPDEAPPAASEPSPRSPEPNEPKAWASMEAQLISSATNASVSNAFEKLSQTVLTNNAKTLEDLAKEMLRPMLKNWLDDNLPVMVERLVRAEIERVARGLR